MIRYIFSLYLLTSPGVLSTLRYPVSLSSLIARVTVRRSHLASFAIVSIFGKQYVLPLKR